MISASSRRHKALAGVGNSLAEAFGQGGEPIFYVAVAGQWQLAMIEIYPTFQSHVGFLQ